MENITSSLYSFEQLRRVLTNPVTSNAFDAYEINKINHLALLVQTGYLTIKGSQEDFGTRFYNLGFPNQEVSYSFKNYLLNAECCTNKGRIDAVAGHGEWLYLVEFKLDKNADVALDQIKKNAYFEKYLNSGKRIVLIGANVDYKNRELTNWKFEEL